MVVGLIANVTIMWEADCHHTNLAEELAKCSGSAANVRTTKSIIATTVLDVVSDVLIASIPICLLWKVKISTRQKVGLGLILSLSLSMAIIAVVRVIGTHLPGSGIDSIWGCFWAQNECNIAVLMVSLVSFRSFFVARRNSEREHGMFRWMTRVRTSLRQKLSRILPWMPREEPIRPSPEPYHHQHRSEGSDRPMIQSPESPVPIPTTHDMRTATDDTGSTPVVAESSPV